MRRFIVLVIALFFIVLLFVCSNNSEKELKELQHKNDELQAQIERQNEYIKKIEAKPTSTPAPSPKSTTPAAKSSGSSYKGSTSNALFTNKFGTSTTICAHPGCKNYIAPSGDTNCCTVHSNKCLQCGKYIDEDAMYCVDCLVVAFNKVSGK